MYNTRFCVVNDLPTLQPHSESTSIRRQLALPGSVQKNYHNTVISGGSTHIRALALLKTCEDAYDNGLPTIIIHCANYAIENYISNSFTIRNRVIINSSNGLYDPFLGLSNTDITSLFIQSAPDYVRQNWNFSALVGLIAELYHIRQLKNITLKTLLKTKVMDLPRSVPAPASYTRAVRSGAPARTFRLHCRRWRWHRHS